MLWAFRVAARLLRARTWRRFFLPPASGATSSARCRGSPRQAVFTIFCPATGMHSRVSVHVLARASCSCGLFWVFVYIELGLFRALVYSCVESPQMLTCFPSVGKVVCAMFSRSGPAHLVSVSGVCLLSLCGLFCGAPDVDCVVDPTCSWPPFLLVFRVCWAVGMG